MSKEDHSQNNRNHKRYNIKSGAFALLKSDTVEVLGSIKDISVGGLCLSHIDENEELKGPEITVNLISEKNCFENFPSKAIWNKQEDGAFMAAMVKMRRRGIQFEQLTAEKQLQLSEFIDTLTKK